MPPAQAAIPLDYRLAIGVDAVRSAINERWSTDAATAMDVTADLSADLSAVPFLVDVATVHARAYIAGTSRRAGGRTVLQVKCGTYLVDTPSLGAMVPSPSPESDKDVPLPSPSPESDEESALDECSDPEQTDDEDDYIPASTRPISSSTTALTARQCTLMRLLSVAYEYHRIHPERAAGSFRGGRLYENRLVCAVDWVALRGFLDVCEGGEEVDVDAQTSTWHAAVAAQFVDCHRLMLVEGEGRDRRVWQHVYEKLLGQEVASPVTTKPLDIESLKLGLALLHDEGSGESGASVALQTPPASPMRRVEVASAHPRPPPPSHTPASLLIVCTSTLFYEMKDDVQGENDGQDGTDRAASYEPRDIAALYDPTAHWKKNRRNLYMKTRGTRGGRGGRGGYSGASGGRGGHHQQRSGTYRSGASSRGFHRPPIPWYRSNRVAMTVAAATVASVTGIWAVVYGWAGVRGFLETFMKHAVTVRLPRRFRR